MFTRSPPTPNDVFVMFYPPLGCPSSPSDNVFSHKFCSIQRFCTRIGYLGPQPDGLCSFSLHARSPKDRFLAVPCLQCTEKFVSPGESSGPGFPLFETFRGLEGWGSVWDGPPGSCCGKNCVFGPAGQLLLVFIVSARLGVAAGVSGRPMFISVLS